MPSCDTCYEPIIFQDRQPYDFTVCDCGRLVATVLHWRNADHIKAKQRGKPKNTRRPVVPRDRELKPVFGTKADLSDEERASLERAIREASK